MSRLEIARNGRKPVRVQKEKDGKMILAIDLRTNKVYESIGCDAHLFSRQLCRAKDGSKRWIISKFEFIFEGNKNFSRYYKKLEKTLKEV